MFQGILHLSQMYTQERVRTQTLFLITRSANTLQNKALCAT